METNLTGNGMQGGSGGVPTRFEHLRGLLRRMDRIVDSSRDQRLGRVIVAPTVAPASIPFPKAQATASSGKPRAVAKSLQDFEAAFARLTDRQVG
ncbi:MAG: hypothetical protein FJ292_02030 [Planctomycetes bacterium]|nr:hypothetical protein [Planctomycetota bacterium]